MSSGTLGALLLGAVIGYLVHYLVRRDASPGIKDLGGIIAAILGGVILKVLTGSEQVNWYLIGLGAGFFLYWLALMAGREKLKAVATPSSSRSLTLFPFLR